MRFYSETVEAEYAWHEECERNPLALQQLMTHWGMSR